MDSSSNLSVYHFDGSSNTVAITNGSQTVVKSYAYQPYGTLDQPFTFVGQFGVMREPNSFYYMRARYYDPEAGRFISEDPIGFEGEQANLYSYVLNNPINRIDPSGLLFEATSYQVGLAQFDPAGPLAVEATTAGLVISRGPNTGLPGLGTNHKPQTGVQADFAKKGGKGKKRGKDRKKQKNQVKDIARRLGLDPSKFSRFIHDEKRTTGRGGADNFTFEELMDLGQTFNKITNR